MFASGGGVYYEGAKGAERMVKLVKTDGAVHYYEGREGAERRVRTEQPDGVTYYEGEKGQRAEGANVKRRGRPL